MQRAHPQAGDNPEELGAWLGAMDEDQIDGVVSNTKGVLHEMEFVRIENEDGDSVHAALFQSTNNPGYDVQFVDQSTGEIWQVQLKATDSGAYIQEWLDAYPDGEILVTQELADAMVLPSSGISNEALTARTEDIVDRLLAAGDQDDLWDYFPGLAAVSVALVVWSLFGRYRRGEITLQRFKWLAAKVAGFKAGKLALLTLAMSVPGVNVATGAALVVALLFSSAGAVREVAKAAEGRTGGRRSSDYTAKGAS